jgi:translocation and assembly module TamA
MTPLPFSLRRGACLLFALCALAPPALADIEVDLEGIEGELRSNVLVFLSVQRYQERDDIDEDTMLRLYNRIEGEVRGALRPLGYYEPTVEATYARQSGGWRVRINVVPGEPVRVRELKVAIEGPGADDPVFASVREQTDLRLGMRLHHGAYEKVKGDLTRIAAANGYLAARLLDNKMPVDPESHTAGILLRLDTGPRYSFGDISIEQRVIRPKLMQRFVRFNEGEPYNTSQLLSTQFALDDSLYFSRVDVTPGEPDPQTLTVPVSITAAKSRPVLLLGGGYGSETRLRGNASWTDSRVNDKGHRLRFEIEGSKNTRTFDSRYDIPIGDPALEKFSVELLHEVEEVTRPYSTTSTLRPSVTRVHERWQTVTSLSATRTSTRDVDDSFTSNLLVPGLVVASVPQGFLGEALFSHGVYGELQGSHEALGADTRFLRASVQLERTFDLSYYWHLLLRGQVGSVVAGDFSQVPVIYRFKAGGDRSVRGFANDSLQPKEPCEVDGVLTECGRGGQHLLTGTVELIRDLPLNLAAACFFDSGNAFDKFGDELEYAAGVGVRYRLPGLSLGVDVAKPLSTGGKYRFHLNISAKL